MKGVWEELKHRAEDEEEEGLLARPKQQKLGTPGAYSGAGATEEAGDGILDSGFVLREITTQTIRTWLAFQIIGLLFQFSLWSEVSAHLSEFEDVVSRECAHEHLSHGVCVAPMWNMSAWQDVVLENGGSHSFDFKSISNPPTFLVVVDPVSEVKSSEHVDPVEAPTELAQQGDDIRDARWTLEVIRTKPPQVAPAMKQYRSGQDAISFEDLSTEAQDALASSGGTEWKATVRVRGHTRKKTRYVAFVEDAVRTRLGSPTSGSHCAFGHSWKAFNQQHQGTSHRKLSWCSSLLGTFLFVGGFMVYAVHQELTKAGSMTGYRFHLVVLAKFFLLDLPQQVCIVLYILGWYEAAGLRCQLCMFHPQHCGEERVFSFSNSIAFLLVLLSSVANQLLLRPVIKKSYTEDDICLQYCIRVGGVCLSILPFTTGLCLASRSILPVPGALHIIAAVPLGIGYLTLAGVTCVPILACCDEDCADL